MAGADELARWAVESLASDAATVALEPLGKERASRNWRLCRRGSPMARMKQYRLALPWRHIRFEVAAQTAAAAAGIAPQILAANHQLEALIDQWIERAPPAGLIGMVGRLHAIDASQLRQLDPRSTCLDYLVVAESAGASVVGLRAEVLAQSYRWSALDRDTFCHMDIHAGNIQGSYLIDFEYAHRADPLWDWLAVAQLLARPLDEVLSRAGVAKPSQHRLQAVISARTLLNDCFACALQAVAEP